MNSMDVFMCLFQGFWLEFFTKWLQVFQHNLAHLISFTKQFVSSYDKNKSGSWHLCAEQEQCQAIVKATAVWSWISTWQNIPQVFSSSSAKNSSLCVTEVIAVPPASEIREESANLWATPTGGRQRGNNSIIISCISRSAPRCQNTGCKKPSCNGSESSAEL